METKKSLDIIRQLSNAFKALKEAEGMLETVEAAESNKRQLQREINDLEQRHAIATSAIEEAEKKLEIGVSKVKADKEQALKEKADRIEELNEKYRILLTGLKQEHAEASEENKILIKAHEKRMADMAKEEDAMQQALTRLKGRAVRLTKDLNTLVE